MPPKAPPSNLDDAIQAYIAGDGYNAAARRFKIGVIALRDALRDRGLLRSRVAQQRITCLQSSATRRSNAGLPEAEIVRRYQDGESMCSLAEAFNTTRIVIKCRLRAAGIPMRSGAEANRLAMSARTAEEHRRNTAAAHVARRGNADPLERRCRRARTRQERQTHSSPNESLLRNWLAERGVEAVIQQAIGPYNTDLGAAPVAVEVFGGNWHAYGYHRRIAAERFGYLLDLGWNLVIVWVDQRIHPLTTAAADYIVPFVKQSRSDPTFRRQYRVIWGDGQEVPVSGDDLDQLAHIPSRGRSDSSWS